MRNVRPAYLAAAAAFLVTAVVSHLRATPYNNYVLLAQAFVHGQRGSIGRARTSTRSAYTGQHYVIEAPMPAVLLVPLRRRVRNAANQTLLVGGARGGRGRRGLASWANDFGLPPARNAWICAFLLVGTDLLWCAMLGDVWFIAHVSAVCFTMLALAELRGQAPSRGWSRCGRRVRSNRGFRSSWPFRSTRTSA